MDAVFGDLRTRPGAQDLAGRLHGTAGGVARSGPASAGFPLTAEKIEGRAALLRGIGNAIVAPLAATFIRAFLQVEAEG